MLTDGTIGVLYITHDGSSGGLPTFSAHLARSTDQGSTFSDVVLQSFSSPVADNGNARQRIFGDFEQMKAVGTTFYGVYSGNRNGFGSSTSAIDPIFFSVPQATQTTVTSSVNPSVFTQPVSFTATVAPVPDGGTVQFKVDSSNLGAAVAVNTSTGQATSISTTSLAVGSHNVQAIYSGNANFAGSTGTLTQIVNQSPTTTTYTGQTTSDFHDAFTASATLTGFGGAPLAGKTITFILGAGTGTETCSAPTDGSGIAQCSLTPNEAAGSYTLTASFAGDTNFLGSSDPVAFTITKEETALHYTGPTLIPNGQNVSFSGLLKEDDVVPIAGRTVTITIGSGGTAQSCAGVTNAAGVATCSILAHSRSGQDCRSMLSSPAMPSTSRPPTTRPRSSSPSSTTAPSPSATETQRSAPRSRSGEPDGRRTTRSAVGPHPRRSRASPARRRPRRRAVEPTTRQSLATAAIHRPACRASWPSPSRARRRSPDRRSRATSSTS